MLTHTSSVWALAASNNFNELFTAGRDGNVCTTNSHTGHHTQLLSSDAVVAREPKSKRLLAPLKLALTPDCSRIWMSTTCADIYEWKLDRDPRKCSERVPSRYIRGLPGLVRHQIMHNRRNVATQDEDGLVEMWNVTTGERKQMGIEPVENFEEVVGTLDQKDRVNVPSWFSLDTKLGSLTIHLTHPRCFDADVYVAEAGIPEVDDDKDSEVSHSLR